MPGKKSRRPSKKPSWQKDTVKERIGRLFDQAEQEFSEHPERSRRYVEMALKLSMRYNVTISSTLKRRFCRKCKAFLVPGKNSRVRISTKQKAVTVTCKDCGHVTRLPYRKEKSLRKA
jgi:ribonuclease P protein subunit RPR2